MCREGIFLGLLLQRFLRLSTSHKRMMSPHGAIINTQNCTYEIIMLTSRFIHLVSPLGGILCRIVGIAILLLCKNQSFEVHMSELAIYSWSLRPRDLDEIHFDDMQRDQYFQQLELQDFHVET